MEEGKKQNWPITVTIAPNMSLFIKFTSLTLDPGGPGGPVVPPTPSSPDGPRCPLNPCLPGGPGGPCTHTQGIELINLSRQSTIYCADRREGSNSPCHP